MSGSIVKSAFIIVAVTLIGRLLGFIRNIFMSDQFGLGVESAAYFAAFTIPLALSLVIPGAINSILIPTMKGLLIKNKEQDAVFLYHKMFTVISVFFIFFSILAVLFADSIITILVPHFTGYTHELTVELFKVMIPSSLFIGLMGLFSSMLNVHNEFFISSFGSVVNSLIIIASFFIFVPLMGIHGVALGTLMGFIGFAFIMVPSLYRKKYTFRFNFSLQDPLMKSMGERLVPIMIGSIISQLTMFLERFFVSQVGEAKLSALIYANQIMQLPMAIFVGAFTLPLFPLLSEYVKKNELKKMRGILEKGLLYLIIFLLPVTLGLILLSVETCGLLYERGKFSPDDTKITAIALVFYSVGLLGLACRDLITRAFYALEDTKTPVIIGIVTLILYVVFANALMPVLNHGGIALAASLAAFSNTFILGLFLRRKMGWSLLSLSFYKTLGKSLVATAIMSAVIWYGKGVLSFMPNWLFLILLIVGGAGIYFMVLILFKEKLVWDIFDRIKQKVGKKKATTNE